MLEFPSPALIGVIHLAPLPGSARHTLSMKEIIDRAITDARSLQDAGFDAAIIENYGDAPFTAGLLPPASVAATAVAAQAVREQIGLRIGINALRNDARAALGIASATGATFIRVNVHTGVYATDQGLIEGRAHETLQYRRQLGARIAIFADVAVKHARPLSEPDISRAAKDVAYRGLADALIVTGPATGEPVDLDEIRRVAAAVPDRRLFVGSGATIDTVASLLTAAGGIIVGTGIKVDGITENPIDPERARSFARAAGR
jgi:uncharacterized protein